MKNTGTEIPVYHKYQGLLYKTIDSGIKRVHKEKTIQYSYSMLNELL